MLLKALDLTTALRPSYLPEEVLLFLQDNVGLYEGKFKLPSQQNGQVYLTSHRICYVDKDEPRLNSVALDLKDIYRHEHYAGFFKSSPKITLIPQPSRRTAAQTFISSHTGAPNGQESISTSENRFRPPTSTARPITTATWVCTICSFSNQVPAGFDPATASVHTPLPPCKSCGIKPSLPHVLKAAIANASSQPSAATTSAAPDLATSSPSTPDLITPEDSASPLDLSLSAKQNKTASASICPRCTFSNHPSLNSCEMCGARLTVRPASLSAAQSAQLSNSRVASPGPVSDKSNRLSVVDIDLNEGVKISFRDGGDKIFLEKLKGALTQRKWVLRNAPPVPKSYRHSNDAQNGTTGSNSSPKTKTAGIAGLEQLGVSMRKNNDILMGSAFEDLEALMASAKEVVALAERFARQKNSGGGDFSAEESAILAESASQLGLITTKDMVGGGKSESLYLSELSRNLAEFLTDDSRGVLKKAGGILTLVDLWAMFNRARGGVELVSPMDFEKAARLWESLKLPVRLRTFRSGVMVVQGRDRTDEITIKTLLSWLQDLHEFPPDDEVLWDWRLFGRGVTAQDAAERFGWSLGVAEEELLMAEERGVVCREEGLEGLKFWENFIGSLEPSTRDSKRTEEEVLLTRLRNTGLI